jgi:Flp pilus assembly protein TadB
MANERAVGAILVGAAALLLLLVQFLPWAVAEESGGGSSMEATAYLWEVEVEYDINLEGFGAGFSDSGKESQDWYDDDTDEADGVGNVRASIPMFLVGLVGAAVAVLLMFLLPARVGGVVALACATVLVVAFILYTTGVNEVFDGDQDWHVSFFFGLAGIILLIIGGVVALVGGAQRSARPPASRTGPNF